MISRGVIIGIGTVILVIGLTGLGLLQTGVISPPEVRSLELAAKSGQQTLGPVDQTAQAPAPDGPGAQAPTSRSVETPAAAPPPPASKDLTPQKPIPVPQVGNGERRYPKQRSETAQAPKAPASRSVKTPAGGPVARNQKLDQKRRPSHPKFESKRNLRKSESKRYARKTPPAHTGQPVVIRFNFDPAKNRRIAVARVHQGDKVRVKVQRVGQVDRRVYFTFSSRLNSPQGAVLKLETMNSFERPVIYRRDRGYYVIEVRIYPGNRWNAKPRSFV